MRFYGRRCCVSALIVALLATAAGLSGCSNTDCASPNIPSSSVWLSSAAWQRSHPLAHLSACINTHCQSVPSHGSPTQIVLPRGVANADTFTFSVKATLNGSQVLDASMTMKLLDKHVQLGHGCGGYGYWQRNVRLTNDGRLIASSTVSPPRA